MTLHIGRDFCSHAHTRYRKDGPNSGEAFRVERLVPALELAIKSGATLTVTIDVSCSAAFLHEAFSKLQGHGFTPQQICHHLNLAAAEESLEHYAILALRYLREGCEAAA